MTCPDCKGKGTITLLTTAEPRVKCGGRGRAGDIALTISIKGVEKFNADLATFLKALDGIPANPEHFLLSARQPAIAKP